MVDGTNAKYIIPEGTQPGTKFTIRNKGFKNINSNYYGDFVFTVQVQVPKRLSKEQREILLQLAKTMNEQPPVKRKDYLANKFGGRLKTPTIETKLCRGDFNRPLYVENFL